MDLKEVLAYIKKNRQELTERLVQFSLTDLIFFWGQEKDLILRQKDLWEPLLEWAKNELEFKFDINTGVVVPMGEVKSGARIRYFMNGLSDKQLAAFYVAALNLKSMFLAMALVKKEISVKQALTASFLEEQFQGETWGGDDESRQKWEEIKKELYKIEAFLK